METQRQNQNLVLYQFLFILFSLSCYCGTLFRYIENTTDDDIDIAINNEVLSALNQSLINFI